jgi:hypothetical protein
MHQPSQPPLKALPALLFCALLASTASATEPGTDLHIVKFLAGDATVIEADVTDLLVGESQTFVTENGDSLDVLRTHEGLELYLNGELLDPGLGGPGHHGQSAGSDKAGTWSGKRVEKICQSDAATGDLTCDEEVWISGDATGEWDELTPGDEHHARIIVIEKDKLESQLLPDQASLISHADGVIHGN